MMDIIEYSSSEEDELDENFVADDTEEDFDEHFESDRKFSATLPKYSTEKVTSAATQLLAKHEQNFKGTNTTIQKSQFCNQEDTLLLENDVDNEGESEDSGGAESSDDDFDEYRTYHFGESNFTIPKRYVVKDLIGKGAYGIVCSAVDRKRNCKVAIKKIESVFDHKTYMKRTLRELRFLRSFRHENLISLRKIIKPLDLDFNDIYLVTELMETDLSCIIRSPQKLTDEHCQFFIYQVLRGLKYIHDADIVHRDLKPRNLLVNSNCDLKICDFGLARIFTRPSAKKSKNMTDYVATRWYRAPEVILSWKKYGKPIDMWAVGCILAELMGRKPIFPGKDAFHQLSLIINVLGSPDGLDGETLQEKGRELIEKLPPRKRVEFSELYPDANPLAWDLLEKLLQFDPDQRITVQEALQHPYLQQLHCPEDEPSCTTLNPEDWEFDYKPVTKEDVKMMICKEIMLYNPDVDISPAVYRLQFAKPIPGIADPPVLKSTSAVERRTARRHSF